jgi:hypothetical protein
MILALGSATLAAGDDTLLGTKRDIVATPQAGAPSASLMPLLQMAIAVGVVLLLLKVWLPKAISKLNKGLKGTLNGGLRVEEAATFAGGTLNVVSVRGRTLLLCVGTQGVTFLTDLTEAKTASEPAFTEILATESSKAAPSAVIDASHRSSPAESGPQTSHGGGAAQLQQSDIQAEAIQAALNRAKLLAA